MAERTIGDEYASWRRQGYHVPAVHLHAWSMGLCDEYGAPTAKALLGQVEAEARSHWREMHRFRRKMVELSAEPDWPLRDEWIERTRQNADWHGRRLVELLNDRKWRRAALLPVRRDLQMVEALP